MTLCHTITEVEAVADADAIGELPLSQAAADRVAAILLWLEASICCRADSASGTGTIGRSASWFRLHSFQRPGMTSLSWS